MRCCRRARSVLTLVFTSVAAFPASGVDTCVRLHRTDPDQDAWRYTRPHGIRPGAPPTTSAGSEASTRTGTAS